MGFIFLLFKLGNFSSDEPVGFCLNAQFGSITMRVDEQFLIFRNLPEVRSTHEVLGVPTVSARFGTSPFFWNWGMAIMTSLLPPVHYDFSIACMCSDYLD